jgi:integrase
MDQQIARQRRRTLTDKMVAALPKKRKRYIKADPELGGHYVRVMPDGANVFCVVARDQFGKQIWFRIGTADILRIEEARDQAREAIKRIRAGLPAKEAPAVKPDSFKSVALSWIERHVAKNKLRTQAEIERCLRVYVFSHWADREFTSIKRSDIAALMDHIEDKHGARQADLVLSIMRSIANWFATRSDDYLSPFTRNMRRGDTKKRERILTDDELRSVWKQAEGNGSFGALVRMLLLTGQRRAAVLGMRWDDINIDGVWTIQTEDREKGNAGSLTLPAQALAIIKAQPHIEKNPFVFAASNGGPMSAFTRAKRAFDKQCGVTGWTLHDLRRTARSLMSRAGVSSDHAERVLGHVIPGIEGTYDRRPYFDEKAAALAKLAALIDRIITPPPDNVRQLHRKARGA